MKKLSAALSLTLLAGLAAACDQPAPAPAPPPPPPSLAITNSLKSPYYDNIKTWITKAADVMAEKDYGFHPATMPAADKQEIRKFGTLIGHVAQENYTFCAAASGQPAPAGTDTIEKTKTAKADLQKALADSFAFCDGVWAATNDTNGATSVDLPFNLGKTTRLGTLVFNTTHDSEHYGNIVTYMRTKGIVPPSSAPAGK